MAYKLQAQIHEGLGSELLADSAVISSNVTIRAGSGIYFSQARKKKAEPIHKHLQLLTVNNTTGSFRLVAAVGHTRTIEAPQIETEIIIL